MMPLHITALYSYHTHSKIYGDEYHSIIVEAWLCMIAVIIRTMSARREQLTTQIILHRYVVIFVTRNTHYTYTTSDITYACRNR